jgi:hypothetical protein
MRYSWTQPCCMSCWDERNPNRPAIQMRAPTRVLETCVYCGSDTNDGIYVRLDPSTAPHPTLTKDESI